MTASVKILSTSSVDISPSIIIVSPNGHKTLVNCGEGCQRSFLESTDRVRSVNQICLTHIGYSATGGLPGMILTSADAAQASATSQNGESKGIVGTLKLIGPDGTQDFVHSLRHFMRRDRFPLSVHEGEYHSVPNPGDGLNSRHGKKRKKSGSDATESEDLGLFGVTSIPMKRKVKTLYGQEMTYVSSYLFTSSPIAGKFQIKKARELQIPPGPMYSKLKAGDSVTFRHSSSGNDITINPDQVLEGGNDGVAVAFIYCPDQYVFDQFNIDGKSDGVNPDESRCPSSNEKLNKYKEKYLTGKNSKVKLELMVHYTPKVLFESSQYQAWIREFGPAVKHMTIHSLEDNKFVGGNEMMDGSPFRTAVLSAMQRSLIHSEIYPSPIPHSMKVPSCQKRPLDGGLQICCARPGLEYTLVPLAKQGINMSTLNKNEDRECFNFGISKADHESVRLETAKSGAIDEATKILETYSNRNNAKVSKSKGCFIFTGTGSAIPCKDRNVTGMYLEMADGSSGMLLDVGEGTLGQLIRSWKSSFTGTDECEYIRKRITNIKAVWISHPHADHHLGLIRFLTQRNAILLQSGVQACNEDRVVLMTSPTVLRFLDEYSKVDPSIYGGYIPVDNRDTIPDLPENKELAAILNKKLGITRCVSVPVSHCYQSFAVVIDGTSFGRVVYSGDCRPSDHLTQVGAGADLLIHEATFEDGMEEEACLKMHSTVSEALSIAKRMNAKACILTHFSQRYPRIAPLREEDSLLPFPVAFAFDFMKVTPDNIVLASQLTNSLRKLYPENSNAEEAESEREETDEAKRKAQEILSIPGMFANVQCN